MLPPHAGSVGNVKGAEHSGAFISTLDIGKAGGYPAGQPGAASELEKFFLNNATSILTDSGKLVLHRSMGRYVKELKSGKLKIDKAKIKQDEKLDGKYLLSTSDQHLSAEDIALGYKQLLEVERAFRTLKSTLCLRPVYHSKDDRIRSHVLLCWLALLLVRIAEVETGITWPNIRRQMQQLNLIEFFDKNGRILQHTELTPDQRNILNKLKIKPPKRVTKVDLAA